MDAQAPGHTDELYRLLALVAQELGRGHAPPQARQLLSGASLVALPKPAGGHRPIAVGETLRRVVGKCLAAEAKEDARRHLEPRQLGVGTPAGAETVVHVVRQWFARHHGDDDRVLVKLDMENAFNTVDRQAVLAAVRASVPALTPWADFTYGVPSSLWRAGRAVPSQRGVQQGDPLGPLFFSLALDAAVEKAFQRLRQSGAGALDFAVFYLDDATLAGPAPVVAQACRFLEVELAAIGLRINASKCEAVPAALNGPAARAVPPLFPRFQWKGDGNCEVLGAPIGDAPFCARHLAWPAGRGAGLRKRRPVFLPGASLPTASWRRRRKAAGALLTSSSRGVVTVARCVGTLQSHRACRRASCMLLRPGAPPWRAATKTGMQFLALVVEAHGGAWGPAATKAWAWLSKTAATADGEPPGRVAEQLLQRLSTSLHRENARAVVRRLVLPAGDPDRGPLWVPGGEAEFLGAAG